MRDEDPTFDILKDGFFRITGPGPLHAPVLAFTVHRDEALDLILETRTADDAISVASKIPAGTLRRATEKAELTNIGNATASFTGILTRRVSSHTDERGISEKREIASIHRIEGRMPGAQQASFTLDWIANVAGHNFHWPDSVGTDVKTHTTKTFGRDGNSIVMLGTDGSQSFRNSAVRLSVGGVDFLLCESGDKSDPLRSGYILYVGTPDIEFRRKIHNCLSFALGIYLVHLGTTTYTQDWHIVEFSSISAYSMDRKAFRLVNLPPAPLHDKWQFGVDRALLSRAVEGIFVSYNELKFGNLSWAYWHAHAATPHIAAVHFGAAIEALLRRYADQHPDTIPTKPITNQATWKEFRDQVRLLIDHIPIDDSSKSLLQSNLGAFNRVPLKMLLDNVASHLGIKLSDAERTAWKRRDDAAHGKDMEPGTELELIRENQLLGIILNRLILRMTNASGRYQDYFSLGHKTRRLEEPAG
jgi:hypothetical protein